MAEKSKPEAAEKPRIGVFVCHCGSNIGGFVDVPSVAEYARTLPDVEYATDNLYTCAEDGLSAIREGIRKHNLNRVIVASCTPRTHAPLFQATCESAGLNKYLFTFVNLREHCSWVHMKEKEKATKKARDLVKMGVARARLLEPQVEVKVDVAPSAVVLGGGVSGMTAALSLAEMGFPVHLVERESELGGFVRNLNNLYVTEKSAADTIKPLIEKVKAHKNIKLYLNAQVKKVEGFIGNFDIVINQKGAEEVKTKVGTIVVATGALEFMPEGLYGYNQYPNVVTLTEFEILCKKKTLPKMKNVAFIQCVGSRGQVKTYCSRICCNVAIKNAINIVDNYENMLGLMEKEGTVMDKVPVEKKVPDEILERRRRRRGRERGEEGEAEEVKLGPS
jgi:heterodisulfide reductase subunit A